MPYCQKLLFSSTATLYGNAASINHEDTPLNPINPYGNTKLCIEFLLKDLCRAYPSFSVIALRYYNPCNLFKIQLIHFYFFNGKAGLTLLDY